MMFSQLTLPVRLRDVATFENFYPANNQVLLTALQKFVNGESDPYIYLYGHGHSHLLQACCHQANQQGLTTIYIPLNEVLGLRAAILDNLEKYDLVCLDDVQVIAGHKQWEEAVFYLFNRVQTARHRLLIAAQRVPKELNLKLNDLTSRLMSGLIFQIQELSDADKLAALQLRAKLRGLELSNEVGRFLLSHLPRDLTTLFSVLEKLDQASLASQRKLTIPFLKEVLGI